LSDTAPRAERLQRTDRTDYQAALERRMKVIGLVPA
jgi:hypothetical protein